MNFSDNELYRNTLKWLSRKSVKDYQVLKYFLVQKNFFVVCRTFLSLEIPQDLIPGLNSENYLVTFFCPDQILLELSWSSHHHLDRKQPLARSENCQASAQANITGNVHETNVKSTPKYLQIYLTCIQLKYLKTFSREN